MRVRSIALSGLGLSGLLAACLEAPGPLDVVGDGAMALVDARTIPRVPNPPPASDLVNLAGDLRAVPVPRADVAAYVKNEAAAIRLGKALFWDTQVQQGKSDSERKVACATCHFRAGADPRARNMLNPGTGHVPKDTTFETGGPNHPITAALFPLTRLAVPPGTAGFPFGQRGALDPATDNNDVVGSQGMPFFNDDDNHVRDADGFSDARGNYRRVTGRNAPTVINAVFNHRQFWDGRASSTFNGVNHAGARDPRARVLRADSPRAAPVPVAIAIANASLASQAVVPILNSTEQAVDPSWTKYYERLRDTGQRLVKTRVLATQEVHPNDSVLGVLRQSESKGIKRYYDELVKEAFHAVWWDSRYRIRLKRDGATDLQTYDDTNDGAKMYSLLEWNFALFFGLAIQAYEQTLVSDDTPWDRFRRQHPSPTDPALNPWDNPTPAHISRRALFGAHLFNDRTRGPTNIRCSNCHEQAETTDASVRRIASAPNGPVRNRDGNVIDKGFNNIGVRPTSEDLGMGGQDDFGLFSEARRLFPGGAPLGGTFDGAVVTKGFGVEGAFKIPTLRNVALTAPYFHNGDVHTLREAVAFYSRGGNVAPVSERDGTAIEPLGVPNLTSDEVDAIVAFLETLTDERVVYQKAPFDHPQLFVPNGHDTSDQSNGRYGDFIYEVRAVGAAGGAPIPGFLEGPFR